MSNIVLAVDYDDTIFPWKHRDKKQCLKTMRLVKWCQVIGAYIMIHSASNKDRHQEIIDYCKSHGLKVDSINENPVALPFGQEPTSKPYYNWQLCDRSGLSYASVVLEQAAKEVLAHKRKNLKLNDVG